MNSKALSDISGTPISKIRYYEKIGLLPKPIRLENNYRQYHKDTVHLLWLINFLTSLNFPLADIQEFFQLLREDRLETGMLLEKLAAKEKEIQQQLTLLKEVQQSMADLSTNLETLYPDLMAIGKILKEQGAHKVDEEE